jgi:hypothetical protein
VNDGINSPDGDPDVHDNCFWLYRWLPCPGNNWRDSLEPIVPVATAA